MDAVLYGIGERTKEYLAKHRGEPIYGILDGYRTEGEYCGIPVMTMEALAGKEVQIIILARKASEKIIYGRIREFCSLHNIPVYNGAMQRIDSRRENRPVNHPYLKRNKKELLELMKGYDAISFDIFDTLLVREVGSVSNVFQLVAGVSDESFDFVCERTRAELELAQTRTKVCDIWEIYEKIGNNTGTEAEKLKALLEREIETEKKILKPRAEVLEIYHKAREMGKRVSLISDMYFPAHIIKEILSEKGIEGYEGLFISCEYGIGKAGGLYQKYKEKIKADSYLHIGDDDETDGRCAEREGISAFCLLAPLEMAEISRAGELWKDPPGMLQSVSLTRLLCDPFALYPGRGKIRIESPYELGYCIISPALYCFCLWLSERLKESRLQEILFVARDGFIIKQIFDRLTEGAFQTEYLPVSRTLVMMAMADTEEKVRCISRMSFDGTIQDMLRKRFGLEADEIQCFSQGMSEREYLEKHIPNILRKAKQVKKNYIKFLNKFPIEEGAAVFDFVSWGTCQLGLENVLGRKLQGFYFEKPEDKEGLEYKAEPGCEAERGYKGRLRYDDLSVRGFINEVSGESCENYFLIEPFIKETGPSIREIDAQGNIVYCAHRMDRRQADTVKMVQRGILDYVSYVKGKGYIVDFSKSEAKAALDLWRLLDREYIDTADFHIMDNFDEFSNRLVKAF